MSTQIQPPSDGHIRSDRDGDQQFVLHPANNDLFVRTGRQLIEGCQLSISLDVWMKELHGMFLHVATWCGQRKEYVAECWAAPRGNKVLLFFVPGGTQFNFDLAEELADLNRDIMNDFNIGAIEVGQIPATQIARFLDPEKATQIYGGPR
jgi:hypothetical protein